MSLTAFITDLGAEIICRGVERAYDRIMAKRTAEREEVRDEDFDRAERMRAAVHELREASGDPRP